VLLVATVEESIRIATPLVEGTAIWHDAAYNAGLVGSAALCAIQGGPFPCRACRMGREGACARALAGGEIYWTEVFADAAEAPFPSLADALWLGFLPAAKLAVVLLMRRRLPHIDSRR